MGGNFLGGIIQSVIIIYGFVVVIMCYLFLWVQCGKSFRSRLCWCRIPEFQRDPKVKARGTPKWYHILFPRIIADNYNTEDNTDKIRTGPNISKISWQSDYFKKASMAKLDDDAKKKMKEEYFKVKLLQ